MDKVASTTVSAAEGSRVDGGSDQPEEPADMISIITFILHVCDLRDGEENTVRCDGNEEGTSVDEEEC